MRDIKAAVCKRLIESIPYVIKKSKTFPLCDSCVRSKSSRISFHRDGEHKEQVGVPVPVNLSVRKISTDISGSFETCGDNRERYIKTFMDCDAEWMHVYCMDNLKHLNESQLASEKLKIHQYMSDAPELISRDIVSFLNSKGTIVTWSPPYTLESNSKVECSHQTLMRMGLAMMMASVVPMRFWPYAIMHAAYVYHRLLTTTAAGYSQILKVSKELYPMLLD